MQRALVLIERVATSERPLTAMEINETLRFPKATIHRLCGMLEQEQFLQRELGGQRFLPGFRLRRIALGVLANEHFRVQQNAILSNLSQEIGETCNIAIPEGSQMIYIDRVETHWPLRLQLPIGTHVPLHCTASGKLYLSTLPKKQRQKILSHFSLEQRTPNTLVEVKELMEALERIAEEKVSTDVGEFIEGMVAIAVPINNLSEQFFASLSFHAPTSRMSLEEARGHVPCLQNAARALSGLLEKPNTDWEAIS